MLSAVCLVAGFFLVPNQNPKAPATSATTGLATAPAIHAFDDAEECVGAPAPPVNKGEAMPPTPDAGLA